MKIFFALAMILFSSMVFAQKKSGYDSVLAKKLNADEYGMRKYVLVILKSGATKEIAKAEKDSLFRGHMANIQRLADEGKLAVAGPFGDNTLSYRGLFIFNVETVEQVKTLVLTDPAVKAGIFDAEFLPWYGTAAMQQIPELHKTIQKTSF